MKPIIIYALMFLVIMSFASAENWYIKGGTTGLQNYSGTMNQGFYYQFASTGINLTVNTNQCSPSDTDWSSDGACTQPVFANRVDFGQFSDTGYLWWHPSVANDGTALKFVSPTNGEYAYNVTFYAFSGLVNFSIKKNCADVLYMTSISGGVTASSNSAVNLTGTDTLCFILETPDAEAGDSSGIVLNITSTPSSPPVPPAMDMNITSPANAQTYSSNNITINVSTSSNSTVDKVWYDNGTSNITYTGVTTTNLNNNNYLWTFYANDTAGYDVSATTNFTVNYVQPSVPIINSNDKYGYGYYTNHSNDFEDYAPTNITGYNLFQTSGQIRQQPVTYNGYVYFQSTDGYLYMNNAGNVSQNVMSKQLSTYYGYDQVSTPAIANDTLYIGYATGATSGQLIAVNASNITQVYFTLNLGSFTQSSPTIKNGFIYIGTSLPDAKFLQIYQNNLTIKKSYQAGSYAIGSPACNDNYCYFTSYDANIYQFNTTTFSLINTRPTGIGIAGSPSFNNEYVYFSSDDNNVYQLDANNISIQINKKSLGTGLNYTNTLVSLHGEYAYYGAGSYLVNATGTFHPARVYQTNISNISQVYNTYNTNGSIYSSISISKNNVASWCDIYGKYNSPAGDTNGTFYLANANNISQIYASHIMAGGCADYANTRPYNDSTGYYVFAGDEKGGMYQFYNFTGALPVTPATNFSVNLTDIYDNTRIMNFSINLNNTNYTTTTGTITTNIYTNTSGLFEFTIYNATSNTGDYYPRTIHDVNITATTGTQYTTNTYQSIIQINPREIITNRLLKYNHTQNLSNTTTFTGGSWQDQSNINDQDFSTFAYPLSTSPVLTWNQVYLRASFLGMPVWEVKDGVGRVNLTIPIDCLLGDDLALKVHSYAPLNVASRYTNWSCIGENNYEYLLRRVTGANAEKVYEARMWYESNNVTISLSNSSATSLAFNTNGNTYNPSNYGNYSNAFDFNESTFSNISFVYTGNSSFYYIGKTFNASTYIGYIAYLTQIIGSSASDDSQFKLETYDGSNWNTEYSEVQMNQDSVFFPSSQTLQYYYLNKNVSGIRIGLNRNSVIANLKQFRIMELSWSSANVSYTNATNRYPLFLKAQNYIANLNNSAPYYDDTQQFQIYPLTDTPIEFTEIHDLIIKVNATDSQNNNQINTFTTTINNTGQNFIGIQSTTNGSTYTPALERFNYTISINAQGYSTINATANIAPSQNTYNHTFNLNQAQTILLYAYDATTLQLINTQTVLFALESNTQQYDLYTTNGTYFADNISTGTYSIQVYATNYSTAYYTATVTNNSYSAINTYLYPNSTTSVIQIYIKSVTDDPVVATITIRRLNGSTYYTVGQKTTDILGYTIFSLVDDVEYKVIIDAVNYTTRDFNFKFYQANSPYIFRMTPTGISAYIDYNAFISYYYTPLNTTLKNQSWTFTWTTYSQQGMIEYTFMTINGTTINVTGEPSGTIITQTYDLSGYSGVFPVTYGFKLINYSVVLIPVIYYVDYTNYYNQTLVSTANDFKNALSIGWRTIIAILITLALAITISQVSGIPQGGMITAIGCTILFTVLGWYYAPLGIIITLISLALLYITPEGY